MNANHINPFLRGLSSVFATMCNVDANVGRPSLIPSPQKIHDVSVIIGVTGQLRGQVTIQFLNQSAFNVARTMLGGYETDQLDELTLSALGELGNMMLGSAATELSEQGFTIDITPPTVITGEKIKMSPRTPTLCVPMQICGLGELEVHISLTD